MTVTRDVIRDLWPLYESGEATTDTCALVERYLDGDAELAGELQSQRGLKTLLAYPLPPDLDRELLAKARRRLRRSDFLHRLAIGVLVAFVVLAEIPGGFERALGWLAHVLRAAPAVTGYRTLPDGRRIDVIRLEQRVPGDPLLLHYYSDASGCALDRELEDAFTALLPEVRESRTRGTAINAYDRTGGHRLMALFQPAGSGGAWQRTQGGLAGCADTEAAIARSPNPDRYRDQLRYDEKRRTR